MVSRIKLSGNYRIFSFAYIFSSLLASSIANAAQPVQNGNFETGSFTGWKTTSINGGIAKIVRKGSCYSGSDTTQLPIKGEYAALLRSNSAGSTRSEATLTSAAFNAGDGIAFVALTESADLIKSKNPVKFEVEILDATNDKVLIAYDFLPKVVRLKHGCPSEGRNKALSAHFFSTKGFANEQRGIKIRFRQKTRLKGYSLFTLIDQVVQFNESETPIFYGRPVAQAGISRTSSGTPMLDPTGSFDPDHRLFNLQYTWSIDETDIRRFRKPCVNNIPTGEHRAVLYVSDGQHVMADPLSFSIATAFTGTTATESSTDSATTLPTDVTGPIGNDPECSVDFSNGVGVTDPEVEVTDPNVDVNNPHDLYGDVTPISSAIQSNGSSDETQSEDDGSGETDEDQDTDQVDDTELSSNPLSQATSTVTTQANLSSTMILWKPVSEGNGKLVVLTPSYFEELNISILNASGEVIDQGNYVGRTNGDRPTYRFSRAGGGYPDPSILEVGNTRYLVTSPALRVN